MNVDMLFIMICIDKYIERLYRKSECISEGVFLDDLSNFMYDCLLNFNNLKTVELSKFGEYLVQCSLSSHFYEYCSKFNVLYKKKVCKLVKKGKF